MANNQDLILKFIDLGLPSGTFWGNVNAGAEEPEDPGIIARIGRIDILFKQDEKYKRIVPTKEQFKELFYSEYTTIEKIKGENAWGYKITSKINGSSIYLPVGKVWINRNGVEIVEHGGYATSSYYYSKPLEGREPQVMNMLYFISEYRAIEDNVGPDYRCMVRYVSKQ